MAKNFSVKKTTTARVAIFLPIAFVITGCSTSKISTNSLHPGREPTTVLIRSGVGIFVDKTSLSIGWVNETRMSVPLGTCQVVIISDNEKEIVNLLAAAGGPVALNNICIHKRRPDEN